MKKFVDDNMVLKNVEDDSLVTVADKYIREVKPIEEIEVGLIIKNKKYTVKDYQSEKSKDTSIGAKEFPILLQNTNDLISKLNTLNQLRFTKYSELYNYSQILNKELPLDKFSEEKRVEIKTEESKS